MKNQYEIRGDVTVIKLNRGLETLISTSKLEKVKSIPGRWTADKDYRTAAYYVKTQIMTRGINKTIPLHRFITDAPKGKVVDHENRKPLDNTDGNLRVVSHATNSQNTGLSKNNTTGFRGVSPYKNREKVVVGYKATIMVNGVRSVTGYFKTVKQAAIACYEYCKTKGVHYPHTLEEIEGVEI